MIKIIADFLGYDISRKKKKFKPKLSFGINFKAIRCKSGA